MAPSHLWKGETRQPAPAGLYTPSVIPAQAEMTGLRVIHLVFAVLAVMQDRQLHL